MKPDSTEARMRHGHWATAAGVVVLLWLAWRVLSLGAADYLAAVSPDRALRWREDHDQALFEAARANIRDAPEAAVANARRALSANPLQGVAYRLLAMHSTSESAAARLYSIATTRAPRDVPSLAWLADRALARADYGEALAGFDQILRVEPGALASVTPPLEFIASQPAARDAFATLLAARPPWRTDAILALARGASDPASLAALFDHVGMGGATLSHRELAGWLDRLISEREWAPAYFAWASHLPPDKRETIGNVYNGGFEWEPTNIGFDWRFQSGKGVHVARSAGEGVVGSAALLVVFDQQRVSSRHVAQLLALPAGRYEIEGRARVERLQASQGVAWLLACAEGGPSFAQTRSFSGNHGWEPFSTGFEVPAHDCGAQWLRLRNLGPAGQMIDGSIWFDDLRIRKMENATSGGEDLHSGLR